MKSKGSRSRGQLVANFLAGSWRNNQTPLDISDIDLELITRLLFDSGGVGLSWWRIRESELNTSTHGELLHQGYRLQALQSAINEERTITALRVLRDAGIEPILIKGWSVARLYPNPTLRAYGDVDLLVKPSEYVAAREILNRDEHGAWWVDLHEGLFELQDRPIEELFERSSLVDLRETKVRVLGVEDSLALLALHLFKHGAWRPSWLCDIAAIVERLKPAFDWELCFGSKRKRAAWIACAILLANQLLKADINNFPLDRRTYVPDWLTDAVLKQWGNLSDPTHLPVRPRRLMASSFGSPAMFLREVLARWPDPIVATFDLGGQVNDLPRLPYQTAAFFIQAKRFLIDRAFSH